ncbi:MAG: hypothetical protein FVQ82_03735 [Planctomycetes bacterium]|nr:hypothetical protein [Planctomycetota bacterium]
MHIETQFSIFMINKPGVLGNLLDEFGRAKLNIIALTVMDSVEHGVLRIVCGSREKVRKLLAAENVTFNETEVLCVNLPNKVGAFADVARKLADAHINVSYAYCTAGARGGRTTGILKVADVKKAIKILKGNTKTTNKSAKKIVKRSAARKK